MTHSGMGSGMQTRTARAFYGKGWQQVACVMEYVGWNSLGHTFSRRCSSSTKDAIRGSPESKSSA